MWLPLDPHEPRRTLVSVGRPPVAPNRELEVMGYTLSRFDKAASGLLADDEHIVGGTWARTPGAFAQERAFGLLAGQAGSGSAGALRLPKSFEVAVTDRRLLVFSRNFMTGRPDDVLATIELAHVRAAALADDAHKIYKVEVHLDDGGTFSFEVAKAGARKLAESFVEAVNGAVAARSAR